MSVTAGVDVTTLSKVPATVITSLQNYVENHQPVGGFLTAVLTNDLTGSVNRADNKNLEAIPHIVKYIYWTLPLSCWGTREKVYKWLEKK